jgi:hypothetical protein
MSATNVSSAKNRPYSATVNVKPALQHNYLQTNKVKKPMSGLSKGSVSTQSNTHYFTNSTFDIYNKLPQTHTHIQGDLDKTPIMDNKIQKLDTK